MEKNKDQTREKEMVYERRQWIFPISGVFLFLIGFFGFFLSFLKKDIFGLLACLGFVFFFALGLYRILTESSTSETIMNNNQYDKIKKNIEIKTVSMERNEKQNRSN